MSGVLDLVSLSVLVGRDRRCRAVHTLIHSERGLRARQVLNLAAARVLVLHHGNVRQVNLTVVRHLELPVKRVASLVGRLINGLNNADVRVALLLVRLRLRLRLRHRLRRVTLHPLTARIITLGVSGVLDLVSLHILRRSNRRCRAVHGLANTERRAWARHVRQRVRARVLVLHDLHVIQDGLTIVRDLKVPVERVTLSVFRLTNRLNNADVRVRLLDLKLTLPLALLTTVRPRVDNATVTVGGRVTAVKVTRVRTKTLNTRVGHAQPAVNTAVNVRVHALQRSNCTQRARIERWSAQVRVIPVHGRVTGSRTVQLRNRDSAQALNVIEHDVHLRLALRGELPLHLLDTIPGFHADLRTVGASDLLSLTGRLEHVRDLGVKAGDRRIPVAGRGRITLPCDVRVGDGFHLRNNALRQVLGRLLKEHVVHDRGRSLVKILGQQPVVGVEVARRWRVRVQTTALLHVPRVKRPVGRRVHGLTVNGRLLVDAAGRGGNDGLDAVNTLQFQLVHVAGRRHRVQGERTGVAAKRALTERAVVALRHVQALDPQATLMTRATRVHSHDPLLVALIGRVENVAGHVRGRLIRDLPHAVRRRSRVVAVRASSNGLTVLVGHATHATVQVVVNPQLLASLHVGVKFV